MRNLYSSTVLTAVLLAASLSITNAFAQQTNRLDTLKTVFDRRDIAFLKKKGFKQPFLDFLENFRFAGEVHAVREGTPVFPGEPILRVTAKRTQSQLAETALLNTVNFQTMIASKASRVVNAAARGKAVVSEFGLRRAHEADAGLKGARAAYIAGAAGTSNVKAGMEYGIPLTGTMAHSFVMSFSSELAALIKALERKVEG